MPGSRFFTRFFTRLCTRCLMVLILVALLPGLVGETVARAQGPEDDIEALALRAHLQNLRTYSSTAWVGGLLGDPVNAAAETVVGQKLENWTLTGLQGDDNSALANLSRPTLLNFWASWCVPCQLEFPDVVGIATAPDDHTFDVLFVNVFDTPDDARGYLANYPDEIWTVLDPGDKLAGNALVQSIPTSLLLDTDGTVLVVHTGMMTPTVARFLDAVAANPTMGSFDAADYPDAVAQADLPPVDVEAATPIEFNEPASGTITDENFIFPYRFEGRAGQQITVTLDAVDSDLDCYLVVMAADGTRLGEHDDIDPGVIRNSVVQTTLPADGTYLAIATRFLEGEGYEVGDYRLTVTLEDDSPTPQQQSGDHPLRVGDTVTGTLNDDQPEERWTFEGHQGDTITLEMTRVVDEPGGLDGYMLLIGPDGETLTEVDDGPDGLMPLLKNYELPADGAYTVVAARFGFANGFSAGEYTLTLTSASIPTGGTPGASEGGVRWIATGELPPDLRRITYNGPVAGAISSEDFEDWYLFSGRAGDVLNIHMEAKGGDLDPFLLLTDSAGYELAQNDDAPQSDGDAAISAFELPADGRYLIRATRYGFANGISSGGYTLLIETDAVSVEVNSGAAVLPLAYGQAVTGSLTLDEPAAHYTFEAEAGDVITISAQPTEGDLDLGLLLLDPDGAKIAVNSAWLSSSEARLNHLVLPAAGTYTLEVALEDFGTSGSYRLILLQDPAVDVDSGSFEPTAGLDIEVVLIWAGEADLDLSVTAPDGTAAARTATAHDFCANQAVTPVEQVTWETGEDGFYTASVQYRLNCAGQGEPVQFILALVKDGQVELVGGTLAQPGDSYTVPFEYLP